MQLNLDTWQLTSIHLYEIFQGELNLEANWTKQQFHTWWTPPKQNKNNTRFSNKSSFSDIADLCALCFKFLATGQYHEGRRHLFFLLSFKLVLGLTLPITYLKLKLNHYMPTPPALILYINVTPGFQSPNLICFPCGKQPFVWMREVSPT